MYKIPLGLLKDILDILIKMEEYLGNDIGSRKVSLLRKIKKIRRILQFLINEEKWKGTD